MKGYVPVLLSMLILSACNKKEESNTIVAPSDLAPFIGTWAKCVSFTQANHGTAFSNTSSNRIELRISANGTYQHFRWYFSGVSNCLGGDNAISYEQSGTLDITGPSTSITGAKDATFSSSSTVATIRTNAFKTPWNSNYPHAQVNDPDNDGTGTVVNGDSAYSGSSAGLFFGEMFGPTSVTYNALSVSGTTLTMDRPFDWEAGVGGPPTSASFTLTKQ